jgi:phage terminase small subunit
MANGHGGARRGAASLTDKQRAFVAHYLTCWNAAEAARRAGYSEKTARAIGAENLTKPDIQAAITEHLTDLHMSADEALARITARGRSSIADVLALPDATEDAPPARRDLLTDNAWRLDLVKAQRTGAIHQIKKLKAGKYGPEIEMYDRLPALELIGKQHKLFGAKSGDEPPKTPDDEPPTPEELLALWTTDDERRTTNESSPSSSAT